MEEEKIQIAEGVVYPSDEFQQWLTENVTSQPPAEKDRYGRPVSWVTETDTAVVSVTREYINQNSGSWARKRDITEVKTKSVEAEKGGEA